MSRNHYYIFNTSLGVSSSKKIHNEAKKWQKGVSIEIFDDWIAKVKTKQSDLYLFLKSHSFLTQKIVSSIEDFVRVHSVFTSNKKSMSIIFRDRSLLESTLKEMAGKVFKKPDK